MTTPPEVWVPAFRHLGKLTVANVFGAPMQDGTPWCRLCESPVRHGERTKHVRAHQRERDAFKRRASREAERRSIAALRIVNRERTLAGGHIMAKDATTQDAPKRGSTKQLMADIIRDAGSALHVNEITQRVLSSGKSKLGSSGKTPAATLGAQLSVAAKKGDTFVKVAPATFGLIDGPQDLPAKAEEPTPEVEATPAEDLAAQATAQAQAAGKDVKPDPKPATKKRTTTRRRAAAAK